MLLLLLWILILALVGQCHGFVPLALQKRSIKPTTTTTTTTCPKSSSSSCRMIGMADSDDWRLFKAQLVSREQQQQQQQQQQHVHLPPTARDAVAKRRRRRHRPDDVASSLTTTTTTMNSWLYEQTTIEKGCLLVHCPQPQDTHQVLHNHCLFRSVVLITEHNNSITKGLILNLPLQRDQDVLSPTSIHDSYYYYYYGGNVCSVHDDDAKTVYTHIGHDPKVEDGVVDEILTGLYTTTMSREEKEENEKMVPLRDGVGRCIVGYVSWTTLDLRLEMNTGKWKSVSVDATTLDRLWVTTNNNNKPDHVDPMWRSIMDRIGWQPHRDSSLVNLAQAMQQEWKDWMQTTTTARWIPPTRIRLPLPKTKDKVAIPAVGDLFRAVPHHGFLWKDQEFHQSLFLVLQNDNDDCGLTVGVLLHHPTPHQDEELGLPIRYGGPYDQLDIGVDMPPFALYHANNNNNHHELVVATMGEGEPVGRHFWKTSLNGVDRCVANGVAQPTDFLLVRGMCIWGKDDDDKGNGFADLCHQGRFERVAPENFGRVWKTLSQQTPLSPNGMDRSWAYSQQAWQLAKPLPTSTDHNTNDKKKKEEATEERILRLGADAVKVWMLTTLVANDEAPFS